MGPVQPSIVESITSPALLDAIFEMSSRTASMVGFLREFGDARGSGEVKAALLKEQEKVKALELELENLRKACKEDGKRSAETSKELSETSAKLKETADLL